MVTKIAERLEHIVQKNTRDNMAKNKNNSIAVTDEQVELYNTINPLINSIFKELKDFSKKKNLRLFRQKVLCFFHNISYRFIQYQHQNKIGYTVSNIERDPCYPVGKQSAQSASHTST